MKTKVKFIKDSGIFRKGDEGYIDGYVSSCGDFGSSFYAFVVVGNMMGRVEMMNRLPFEVSLAPSPYL